MAEETQGESVTVVSSKLIHSILSVHFQEFVYKPTIEVVDLQRKDDEYVVCVRFIESDVKISKVSKVPSDVKKKSSLTTKEVGKVIEELSS